MRIYVLIFLHLSDLTCIMSAAFTSEYKNVFCEIRPKNTKIITQTFFEQPFATFIAYGKTKSHTHKHTISVAKWHF